jgi:c-di-GMP-binding flagellar brake protein YcgR
MSQNKVIKNRRRYLRAPYDAGIIAHDDRAVFQGKCLNVSVTGMSFYTGDTLHAIGTHLKIHMKPGPGLSPFNASCEVTSVNRVRSPYGISIKYGVRFLNVSRQIQEEIHQYTLENKQKKSA